MKQSTWWENTLVTIEKMLGLEVTPAISLENMDLNMFRKIKEFLNDTKNQYAKQNGRQNQRVAYLEIFNTRDMSAWLSLAYAQDPGVRNPYMSLSEIVGYLYKYLLYYDAVAVVEPITSTLYDADSWAEALKLDKSEAIKRFGTRILQNGLQFWGRMRPALRAGLVEPFPQSHRLPLIRSPEWEQLCSVDNPHSEERLEAENVVLKCLSKKQRESFRSFLNSSRNNFDTSYLITSMLHCDKEGYELVLQTLFSAVLYVQKGLVLERQLKDFQLHVKNDLVLTVCRLPSITDLPIDEILMLHDDNDTFSLWRSQLTMILDDVDLSSAESFRKAVETKIPELSQHLKDKLSSYSLKSRLRNAGISFGAGALGVFSTTGEPISSIIGGAATSAANLLFSLLFQRPKKSIVALQKVYQFMSETKYEEAPF